MTRMKGFIVLNSEGLYAREYEINTHGGSQKSVEWVSDINRASVFINQAYAVRRSKELGGVTTLPAEDVRIVRITGAQ